jgi:hypothetical protein
MTVGLRSLAPPRAFGLHECVIFSSGGLTTSSTRMMVRLLAFVLDPNSLVNTSTTIPLKNVDLVRFEKALSELRVDQHTKDMLQSRKSIRLNTLPRLQHDFCTVHCVEPSCCSSLREGIFYLIRRTFLTTPQSRHRCYANCILEFSGRFQSCQEPPQSCIIHAPRASTQSELRAEIISPGLCLLYQTGTNKRANIPIPLYPQYTVKNKISTAHVDSPRHPETSAYCKSGWVR